MSCVNAEDALSSVRALECEFCRIDSPSCVQYIFPLLRSTHNVHNKGISFYDAVLIAQTLSQVLLLFSQNHLVHLENIE